MTSNRFSTTPASGIRLTIHTELDFSILPFWQVEVDPTETTIEITLIDKQPIPQTATPLSDNEALGWYQLHENSTSIRLTLASGDDRSINSALRFCTLVESWRRGGFLLHGTGLARRGGNGVLGLAVSGGGKSTLTDLADGFESLSDETVLVEWREGRPFLVGTRFRSSSKKIPVMKSVPLIGILILEKSPDPTFEEIAPASAFRSLLRQAYRPPDKLGGQRELLARCRRLAESVPAYRFRFPKSPEAGNLLKELVDGPLAPK